MTSGKPTQLCSHDGSSRKEVISIADKKFRGRDKIVQKMTKDGLVDENLRTGEQKSATAEEKPEKEDSAKETAEKETDEELCMDVEDGEEDAPRPSRAQTIIKPIRRTASQRMRLQDRMQSHSPQRKADFLLKMKKAALSVAWGWALKRWRRKE